MKYHGVACSLTQSRAANTNCGSNTSKEPKKNVASRIILDGYLQLAAKGGDID